MLCPKCQTSISDHEGFCPSCKSPAPSRIYIHGTPALKNLFVAAAQLLREGKVDEAVEVCQDRHRENPAIAGPFVVMGDIYLLNGQLSEAITAYKLAIERTPPYLALVQQKLDDTIDMIRATRLAAERAAAPPPAPEPQTEPEPELPPLRSISTAVAESPAPPPAPPAVEPDLPPPPEPLPSPQWEEGPEAEAEEEPAIAIVPAPKLEAPPQIPLIEEEESNVLEGEVRVAGLPMDRPRPPVEEAEEEGTFIPAAWLEPKRALTIVGALLLLFILLLVLNAKPWQPRYTPPKVTVPIPMSDDENLNWSDAFKKKNVENMPESK